MRCPRLFALSAGLFLLLGPESAFSAVVPNGKAGFEIILDSQHPTGGGIAQVLVGQIQRRTGCAVRLGQSGEPPAKDVLVRVVLGDVRPEGIIAKLHQEGKIELPPQIPPEGFVIRTISGDPQTAVIAAADARGLIFGVGRFLRSLRFFADRVEVPAIDLVDQPQHRYRAEFLATHFQDTGYKDWTPDHWRGYVQDLALWGVNQVWYLPMQFGQTHNVLAGKGTPLEQRRWEVYRQVPLIARQYGLGVGIYIGVNDIFADEMLPEIKAKPHPTLAIEQNHACPSTPEGWKRILQDREQFFKAMPNLDCVYFPTTDYGGCGCDKCMPWSQTYLKLAKAETAILRKYHPNCLVVLSTQAMPLDGQKAIADALNDKPAWADALQAYGSGGIADRAEWSPPAKGPGSPPLIIYPEITMTGGWGNFGAHVRVDAFDYNLPRQKFDEIAPEADGFFCYSEGLHDDVIKIVWAQKAWCRSLQPRDILAEYCRFYFGEEAAPLMQKAMLLMNENWDHRADFAKADEMLHLVEQAEAAMPGWARENWRTRLLKFRAFVDQAKVERRRKVLQAEAHRNELLETCIKADAATAKSRLAEAQAAAEAVAGSRQYGPFPPAIYELLQKLAIDGFVRWANLAEDHGNLERLKAGGFAYWSNFDPGYGVLADGDDGKAAIQFANDQIAWGARADADAAQTKQAAWAALHGRIEAIDFLPNDLPQETASAGWKKGANIPGYLSRGHLVSVARASGRLAMQLGDVVEGDYFIWVHDNNHQGGGCGTDGTVRLLVNGQAATFGNDAAHHDAWTWKRLGPFHLPAGKLDLTLEDAGDGYSVTDCFLITPNPDYRPDGVLSP